MQISKVSVVICVLALGVTLAARAEDNPAQAAARAALAAKMAALGEQQTPSHAADHPMNASMEKEAATPGEPVENGDNPAQAKARAALDQKMQVMMNSKTSAESPPPMTKPASGPAKMAKKSAPPMTETRTVQPWVPVNTGPPLPISEAKQQKLQELLQKYETDQITPEEYHKERAAIISGQ
jgi:hypothetical protein